MSGLKIVVDDSIGHAADDEIDLALAHEPQQGCRVTGGHLERDARMAPPEHHEQTGEADFEVRRGNGLSPAARASLGSAAPGFESSRGNGQSELERTSKRRLTSWTREGQSSMTEPK
jgi:hypothetical protein